jgi:hypothetical protein
MSKLPKATRKRIEADALAWSENQYSHDDVNKDYLEGALHEAGRAQPVIDALQELVNLKCIKEQFGKTDEYLNNQPLAWEAATNALAKYKEVGNG